MPETHTEEEAIRLEWEKTKFTYQRLAESLIDAAKLFATKPVEGASEAEVAKALEKAAKIQAEQQRWENYLGFDKTKKPEPACFNFEKKKDYDERLGTFEARAQSGEEVKLEEVKGLLDELPLGVIWERARVLEESPSLKEYFAGRQLPEDLSEEEKEFFKKYQEFARRPYEEIIRELKQAPEITPKKEAEPTLIYVADEERNKEGAVIYLKEPKKVDNQEITQVTLKPPAITGPESARVFVSAPFKGTKKENEEYTGMGPGTAFDWEKVTSLQFTEKDGNKIRVSKEDLSLEPPKKVEEEVAVKEKEKPVFIKVAFPERAKEGSAIYIIKDPPEVDGRKITQVILKPPAVKGPESAALFVKAPYKGPYGEEFTGMNPGTIFNWENVSSLQFVDSQGSRIRIPKENLSLEPSEKVEAMPHRVGDYEHALHGDLEEELEEPKKKPAEAKAEEPPETKPEKHEAKEEEKPSEELEAKVETPEVEEKPYEEKPPSEPAKKPEMVITGINPFEAAESDLANKWMEADKKELRLLRGLPARVVKHHWFRDYYLDKKEHLAHELLVKAGTPYAEELIQQAREQAAQEIKEKRGMRNLWQKTLGQEKAIHQRSLEIIEDWQESGRLKDFEEMLAHEQSLEETIKRFTQEHDKAIHEAAGEVVKLLDESDEKQKAIANNIRDFIKQYVLGHFNGTLDEAGLTEGLNHYLATQVPQEFFGQAQIYATSLKETGDILIAQLEHLPATADLQQELENTVSQIPIKMGKAVWGVRSGDGPRTRTEKIVRRIRKTWVGGFVNEASLATVTSLALSVTTRAIPSLARQAASMALPVVGGALVGGGFYGLQENLRLKEERITHLRESAQGLEFSPEAKHRAWMEQFVYQSREASEATETLKNLLYQNPEAEKPTLKELDEQGLREAFAELADLRARILLSDTEKIDLISFSAPTQVEIERTNLDLTLSQAEANLRKYLEGKTEFKQTILQEQDFDSYLGSLTELASHAHLEGARTNIAELQRLVPEEKKTVRALDKEFAKKRRIRAVTEGAKAAAIGAAIGEITWELSHFRDLTSEHPQVITPLSWALRKIGAVKEAAPTIKEEVREVAREVVRTTTENLRLRLGPDGLYDLVDKAGHPIPGAENLQTNLDGSLTKKSLEMLKDYGAVLRQETLVDPTAPLVSQGGIRLSQGLRLIDPDGDGKYNLIVEKTGKIFKGLKDLEIDPKTGEISAEMEETLQKASLNVARQTRRFVAGHEDIPVTRTLRNWLVRHTDKVQRIFRDRWYDNDTKMWFNPETGKMEGADFNEIRLLWGDGGDGLTEAGDFALDASYMTPDGSWHDGFSANAQALLAEGKLKLLISLGKDAQNRVLVIPFNRAGKAIIKRASEEARLAFGVRNARAILKGYAAEVAHVTREEGGVQHVGILATHLGENSVSEVVEKISRPIYGQTLTSTITSPGKLFHVTGEAVREITEKVTKKVPEKITTKLIEWVYQGPPVIPIIPRRPLEKAEEAAPPVPPYPEYPEYGVEAYEEYPYEEYEAYLPYYEEVYEALKIPEEEKEELRKKAPEERLRAVAEKAKVTLEEKPYPEQIEELAAQLGIKLEEEKKPEKPLDLKKEVEATMKFPEHSKEQTRKIFFTPDPLAGGDGHLIWQGVCYGKPSKKPDRELFRGYLQVDPTDIPLAIEIMHELAKKRIEDNKSTELKWLIGTRDPESDTRKYEDYIGNYTRLEEAEPRAAIYTETDEEILEIVRALAQDPHWKAIEEKRKASPRRPGVNAFRDSMGQEWRSLNYNEKPGYSEDEAEDPDWRERKEGTPTIFLETKEKRGIEKVSQVIDEVVQRPELRNRAKQLAGEEFSREVFEDVAPDIINTMFEQTIRATFTPESGFDMPRAEEPEGNEEFKTLIPQVQSMILQIVKQDASESGEEYQQRVQNYTHAVCHLLAVEKGVNKDWLKLEEAARFKYLQAILTSYDILKETLKS